MPTAEIITIGTELLLGETADTNTRHIARVLRGLGVDLYRAQTIGDNAARITTTVQEALRRAEIVITTGGLGPTVDDPTRQALADAAGTQLEFHPELWEQIRARVARYGRTPTENQKRQAYIPKGALVIENSVGTAPAFIMELSARPERGDEPGGRAGVVITLPGVPREMETLLAEAVVPYLQQRFHLHAVIQVRTLHVSGMGEAAIDELVGDLETLANPTVGLTAHSGIVSIRIAAKAETTDDAQALIAPIEADLRARLGDNLFGADEDTLESVALAAVAARTWNLVTVEIGSGNTLAERLAASGQPAFVRGTYEEGPTTPRLDEAVQRGIREYAASAGLGLLLRQSSAQAEIELCLITPRGKQDRRLTYGGHPANAARWAVNSALDWLRRKMQESD